LVFVWGFKTLKIMILSSIAICSIPSSTPSPTSLVNARYLRWTLLKKKESADVAIQASDLVLVLNNNDVTWNPSAVSTSPDSTYAIPSESAQNLVDGNILGKYCNINFGFGPTGTATIYIDNITNIEFDSYYYNTGNDFPSRDPVSWTLEFSYNNVDWILIDSVTDATITNDRRTATQKFNISPTRNGLTPQTAGVNAYQIKTDFSLSTDGLYWIANQNISGGTPFQIYADMTTDGGGWTLLLSNDLCGNGWTFNNSILKNQNLPQLGGQDTEVQYSIIAYADYLKSGDGWQYMIEAYERGMYGGIWQPNENYSFVEQYSGQTWGGADQNTNGWRKNITEITHFPGSGETWSYNSEGLEFRMPYYTNHLYGESYITTTSDGSWWGTLVSYSCGWDPSPYMNGTTYALSPKVIWYWVR